MVSFHSSSLEFYDVRRKLPPQPWESFGWNFHVGQNTHLEKQPQFLVEAVKLSSRDDAAGLQLFRIVVRVIIAVVPNGNRNNRGERKPQFWRPMINPAGFHGLHQCWACTLNSAVLRSVERCRASESTAEAETHAPRRIAASRRCSGDGAAAARNTRRRSSCPSISVSISA